MSLRPTLLTPEEAQAYLAKLKQRQLDYKESHKNEN